MSDRIGELLVRENLISTEQLREAQTDQRQSGKRLAYSLTKLGILAERELSDFLSRQYGVPPISLDEYEIDEETLALVPKDVALKHLCIPVQRAGGSLIVAMSDPTNIYAIDDLKFLTGLNIEPVVSTDTAIEAAIERWYEEAEQVRDYSEVLDGIELDDIDVADVGGDDFDAVDSQNEAEQARSSSSVTSS